MIHRTGRINLRPDSFLLTALCVAILFWTAAYPFSRAFVLTSININEGWNVCNAQKVAEHQPLYPSACGWTCADYPALSFHIVTAVERFATDYLFAGRILSLAGLCLSGLFAGLIVWQVAHSKFFACLSGLFLVAIFCANGSGYVGMDDPQMLAQAFFMAGVYVYLRGGRRGWALEVTALLFVLGGNIKHTLVVFPLAVLLDLLFSSPRRALRFAFSGALMVVLSFVLTRRIDGSAYLTCLLIPRGYSWKGAIVKACNYLVPILLPTVTALWMARYCWKNPAQRVLALLLLCSLPFNVYISGGGGVTINAMFPSTLAIVMLTGVFWAEFPALPLGRLKVLGPSVVCAIFFLWLAVPMVVSGDPLAISDHWRTDKALEQNRAGGQRFAAEIDFLRQQPGPALCEDPLRCYYARKPYLYDAFNATRLIALGRLDANVMVDRLRNHKFGAVQLDSSVEQKLGGRWPDGHFAPPILRAIQQYYQPGFRNQDGVIYIPREPEAQMLPKPAAGD